MRKPKSARFLSTTFTSYEKEGEYRLYAALYSIGSQHIALLYIEKCGLKKRTTYHYT